MNRNKIVLGLAMVLFFTFSCKDEDLAPIVTFDSAGKGAYPRLVEESASKLINLFDIAGSSYSYTVEFIDLEGGTLIAEYVLDMTYEDNDPSNGDNSTTVEFLKYSQSDFSTNSNNYQEAPQVTVSGSAALAAAGLSEDEVSAGDNFRFTGRVILSDGSIFTSSNSSATVTGPAFRGHFDFLMPAACPSALEGTFAYSTTDVWCGGDDVTGEVTMVNAGAGRYYFSDWSFGAYSSCYSATSIADSQGLTFDDVCLEVFFTGFTDDFGDSWTYDASVDGDDWTIVWENTYGEAATSVITFPGGVPFTMRD